MTIVINPYWLEYLWASVGGGADVDDHPLEDLDTENEAEVQRLVREYIAPDFACLTPKEQYRLKETFRYGLNAFTDLQLSRIFEQNLPPFDSPQDIRSFYSIIWRELFGPEDWQLHERGQYRVDNDFNFVNAERTFRAKE